MKNYFLPIIALFFAGQCLAQAELTGTITNSNKQYIQLLEVQLLDSSKQLLSSILSNNNGQYGFENLQNGKYYIQLKVDSNTSSVVPFNIRNSKPNTLNIVLANSNKNNANASSNNSLTRQGNSLQKLPTNNINEMAASTGVIVNNGNGAIRSVNSLGDNATFIIDGQKVAHGSNLAFPVGSLELINVMSK
jgi:hypothetical protein